MRLVVHNVSSRCLGWPTDKKIFLRSKYHFWRNLCNLGGKFMQCNSTLSVVFANEVIVFPWVFRLFISPIELAGHRMRVGVSFIQVINVSIIVVFLNFLIHIYCMYVTFDIDEGNLIFLQVWILLLRGLP